MKKEQRSLGERDTILCGVENTGSRECRRQGESDT